MEKQDPYLQQARESLAQTGEQLKAAKAEFLPVLQASGGYVNSRGGAYKPDIETQQWTVGASLSFPLYSGGGTTAKIQRAVSSESERRFMLDEIREQRRENVKQAFYNLRYNYNLIKALEQKKASAEIQLGAVKKGREIGTRSAIDLLNAEQSYSIALRDLKNSLYDDALRVVQLNFAAGTLKDEDIMAIAKGVEPSLPLQNAK
jgi:outer membrane protein